MIAQWLLLILYILMGTANVVRAAQAWAFSAVLTETSLPLPLLGALYLIVGLLFIVVGIVVVLRQTRRTGWLARGLAVGYQILVWWISLIGDRAAYSQRLWGRNLILTLIFLAFVFLTTERAVRLRR